jgi:short-subunit dehydrogenase
MRVDVSVLRHVLVTGAAGAIGGALARAVHERAPRAKLTLVDKDARGVEALAREVGPQAVPLVWDLANPEDLPESFEDATANAPVDALFNCAGIMELRSFAGTPWSLGSRLLAIDFTSPLRLMNLAVPAMRAGRAGTVVNLASLAGILPLRGSSYYGAAKAGLAAASEIARIELASEGIHVLTVYPGPIASGLERHARSQVKSTLLTRWLPLGDAEALAARIVQALEDGAPRLVYPPLYVFAAGALGFSRRVTERWSPQTFD